jgi:hypothetical protein
LHKACECHRRKFSALSNEVLPELGRRVIAAQGLKPLNGKGEAIQKSLLILEEALRYPVSLPVSTTITGMEKLEILRKELQIAEKPPAHIERTIWTSCASVYSPFQSMGDSSTTRCVALYLNRRLRSEEVHDLNTVNHCT